VGEPLLTLADVAGRLRTHPKTLRRKLPGLMAIHPFLRVRKLGRSILFTEHDYKLTVEAIEWQSRSAGAANTGTRAASSGSGRKSSTSPSSAQDKTRELVQGMLPKSKRGGSGKNTLKVLPGGRAASR
jgi:hypothetical protein